MQPRLVSAALGSALLTSCGLERRNENVVNNNVIEVHWWTTSAITSSQGHVEVIRGDEAQTIARLFHGGIRDVVIRQDSIVLTKWPVGVVDFVEDSVYGYKIVLDSLHRSE